MNFFNAALILKFQVIPQLRGYIRSNLKPLAIGIRQQPDADGSDLSEVYIPIIEGLQFQLQNI